MDLAVDGAGVEQGIKSSIGIDSLLPVKIRNSQLRESPLGAGLR